MTNTQTVNVGDNLTTLATGNPVTGTPVAADPTPTKPAGKSSGSKRTRKTKAGASQSKAGKADGKSAKRAKATGADRQQKVGAPKRQYDRFGYVQGTKRSKVAALYATAKGATKPDVNGAIVGDRTANRVPMLNMQRDAVDRGHVVASVQVRDADTGRRVTAYRLIHAHDLVSGKVKTLCPQRSGAIAGTLRVQTADDKADKATLDAARKLAKADRDKLDKAAQSAGSGKSKSAGKSAKSSAA